MKQITITKAPLRTFSIQLEAKVDGFTVKQIRLLDKIGLIIDAQINGYNTAIEKLINGAKEAIRENPTETNSAIVNDKLNVDLDAYTEKYGGEEVTLLFEDEQFNLIKEIWSNSSGYKGQKEARKQILAIDDALEAAIDVPTPEAKKNETSLETDAAKSETIAANTGN